MSGEDQAAMLADLARAKALFQARAIAAVIGVSLPTSLGDEAGDCPDCDGCGRIWNNADPTSGQWVPCDRCGAQ